MAVPFISTAFSAGEIAPSLFGHVDLAKFQVAAATMRNLWVSYRGGAYSRAGTAFVGFSDQTNQPTPPRLVNFQFSINQGLCLEFGSHYMRVISNGTFVTETPSPITGATNANPAVITQVAHGYSTTDWVFIDGLGGMTQLNGRTFAITVLSVDTYSLHDVYGAPIDSTAYGVYTSGGTGARIYTLVTPYAAVDLPYLKWTQSADTMSICCWNQTTGTIYAPYDLVRLANNNWTITATTFGTTISPPPVTTAAPSTPGTVDFQYVITAVDAAGDESIASPIADSPLSVDVASTAGAITVTWNASPTPTTYTYNIYKAPPAYASTAVPVGSLFGYAGTIYAPNLTFIDSNVIPDLSQVPPTAQNPFVTGGNDNPSVVNYFQQRRAYASSPNNPDTYWMSQPGKYTNFDTRIPSNPVDAITGTPWAVEVNGIQFMVPMPGGLVVFTGLSAWQLTGAGGSSLNPQAITPANQQAQPQAYNGCSATVPPIKIDYEILYVQAKGSIVRDLSYNFFVNIYTGIDLTQISSHLFTGFTILEWAWAEEPYKIAWAVRDDGVMLSLTFLKQQEVSGWARHDTQGYFQSVCSVTEPPVDAIYVAVQRIIPGHSPCYMIERMDDRIWSSIEDAWCVDAGLALPQPTPNANLTATSPTGLGAISGVTSLVGGSNYSIGTTATVIDEEGVGLGATVSVTVTLGVVTLVTVTAAGSGYISPQVVFNDPTNQGSGAVCMLTLDNSTTFVATNGTPFNSGHVGFVIRALGGIATITAFISSTQVTANLTAPITSFVPSTKAPGYAAPGNWTLTFPVSTISGLEHLAGATVTGLYDGKIIPPTVVSASGSITLPSRASAVVVGLGFQAQLQSVYLNTGDPTGQGQRKKIADVTVRLEASRDVKVGTNQVDGSTLSPAQLAPVWRNLDNVPDKGIPPYGSSIIPLYTGDTRVAVTGGYQTMGQVAVQQDNPVPLQILALVPEVLPGDTPQVRVTPEQGRR